MCIEDVSIKPKLSEEYTHGCAGEGRILFMEKKTASAIMLTLLLTSLLTLAFNIRPAKTEPVISTMEDWPTFQHDICHTGTTGDRGPKSNMALLWSRYIGGGCSSPIAVNGRIYVGSCYGVQCLNASSGEVVWIAPTGYVVSTPTFYGGKICVGSTDGYAYCLDAMSGVEVWKHFIGNGTDWSSPAVSNDTIYIGSCTVVWSGGSGTPFNATLYALNAATGEEMWNFRSAREREDGFFCSSPAVADGMVFFGSFDFNIYALNASTGSLIWHYPTGWMVSGSPTVSSGIVYIGSTDGIFYALNATTGEVIWTHAKGLPDPAGYGGASAIREDIVYVSANGVVRALNASSGYLIWERLTGGGSFTSPAVADGVLYIGSLDENVYALDAITGEVVWNYATGSYIYSSPAIAYETLFICSRDDFIYALKDAGERMININQSQTWHGDFTVEPGTVVTIEDCNFTVADGDIRVYGCLHVRNSTLCISRNSLFKDLYLYGKLFVYESRFVGNLMITGEDPNAQIIVESSTVPYIYSNSKVNVNVSASSVTQICCYAGEIFISNSHIEWGVLDFLFPVSWSCSNSSIGQMELLDPDSLDLELHTKCAQNLSLHSSHGSSFTLLNSPVTKWIVEFGQNFLLTARLLNSDVEKVYFGINGPHNFTNLVLENGYIEHEYLMIENNVNLTIDNSTIRNWSVGIGEQDNPQRDRICISNSNFSASVHCWNDVDLIVSNSTMLYLVASTEATYASASLNLLLSDSTVNTMCLRYSTGSIDLMLQEGYQECANFINRQQGSNVTVLRTVVNHWGVETNGNATVRIDNSTLTGMHPNPLFAGLNVLSNSKILVHNSNLTGAFVGFGRPSLTLEDSVVHTVWCYDDSNLTAINSTIFTLLTDPPIVTLIDSSIMARIELEMPLSSDYIFSSFSQDCPTQLPSYIKQVSECLNISALYKDFFRATIKISFDKNALEAGRIDENSLLIYYLEEQSGDWLACPIQGVDPIEGYVWANTTHFSYFVIGYHDAHDLAILDVGSGHNVIARGTSMNIPVVVRNQGSYLEDSNITLYVNDTKIETKTLTLTSGSSTAITFTWNTTGFAYGNYTLRAVADVVVNETSIDDNMLECWIIVTIPCDVNGDFKVSLQDLVLLALAYGSHSGDAKWNSNVDIDGNGVVGLSDLVILANHYGQHFP
jgi:outer membrane protein assembly factor BamB